MKGDREKSIAAGASDYITKPVDTRQLLAVMRYWLKKESGDNRCYGRLLNKCAHSGTHLPNTLAERAL